MMRFPSIKTIRKELIHINRNVEGECDVRLCIWSNGEWCVRSGDVQYDQSFADYCGASCVPGVVNGVPKRFNAEELAKDLLDQCREML